MSQTALTIRLDSDLKKSFDSLCEDFGMSSNTAFNIFVRQVVRTRSIPFPIESKPVDKAMVNARDAFYRMRSKAAQSGLYDMTLDQINEEIRQVREEKL